MGDADNGGGYACVAVGDRWEISASFPQFCCEPKSAVKKEVLKKKNEQTKKATEPIVILSDTFS